MLHSRSAPVALHNVTLAAGRDSCTCNNSACPISIHPSTTPFPKAFICAGVHSIMGVNDSSWFFLHIVRFCYRVSLLISHQNNSISRTSDRSGQKVACRVHKTSNDLYCRTFISLCVLLQLCFYFTF